MKITIESPTSFNEPNVTIPIAKIRGIALSNSEKISEALSCVSESPVGIVVKKVVTDLISSLKKPMPGNLDAKLTIETDMGGIPLSFETKLRIQGDRT